MTYSKLYFANVYTNKEKTHEQAVIVTAQRKANDAYGNPMYRVQVWIKRDDALGLPIGNLWAPDVKGYRRLKDDSYTIQSYNIDMDVTYFMEAFEQAVQAD